MRACSDCRRPIPIEEEMAGVRCRICAKLKGQWWHKAVAPTPKLPDKICPMCKKSPRPWDRAYCKPCHSAYHRERRRRLARMAKASTRAD